MQKSATLLQDNPKYRPDIDGLRAIAVLSVLMFHIGLGPFSGGYVGVDVFFVISGFLITRLISDEIKAGTFSFKRFYIRRIRRLFPALFVTLALTFSVSAVILYPWHLERASGSLIYAILSISNFFFWSESGYFDTEADLKPFLPTRSLSVEEQFYLVWPLLLLILITKFRRFVAPVFVITAGLASLWLSMFWLKSDSAAAFFLAPARVVEFSFGAILVWVNIGRQTNPNKWIIEGLNIVGLILIAYATITFDKSTLFPGLNALVPCIGAALVIYAGKAPFSGAILRSRLLVSIGLISYSLYLVHWPILVLYKYLTFNELMYVERAGVVAASIALATLMYHFIEKPFRYGFFKKYHFTPSTQAITYVLCVFSLIVPASHSFANSGWEWRFPKEIREIVSGIQSKRDETLRQTGPASSFATSPFTKDKGKIHLLITGDSHSGDFFNAIHSNRSARELANIEYRRIPLNEECLILIDDEHRASTLKPQEEKGCRTSIERFFSTELLTTANYVVYSTRWTEGSLKWLPSFIKKLKSVSSASLIILGRTAEFSDVPSLIMRFGKLDGLDKFSAKHRVIKIDLINNKLAEIAKEYGVNYFDKIDYICSKDRIRCEVLDRDNNLLIYDYGHWTMDGARYFGGKMIKDGFFSAMFDSASIPPGARLR